MPLPPDVAEMPGLPFTVSHDKAAEWWVTEAGDAELDAPTPPESFEDASHTFRPHNRGYAVALLDGTPSRSRFRIDAHEPTGFQAEWRVANRSSPVPAASESQRVEVPNF